VEEVAYQLEESLQLLEPAGHSLVDCCVPLVASPGFTVSPPSSLARSGAFEGGGGGVFADGLLASTGSASCPLRFDPFSFSPDEAPPAGGGGGFALPSPQPGLEVVRVEAEDLVLRVVGAPLVMGVASLVSPGPRSAA